MAECPFPDCFHCPHPDCIRDGATPLELYEADRRDVTLLRESPTRKDKHKYTPRSQMSPEALEKARAADRAWYYAHREAILQRRKTPARREKHRLYMRSYINSLRLDSNQPLTEQQLRRKAYYQANRERLLAKSKEYQRRKKEEQRAKEHLSGGQAVQRSDTGAGS